MDLDVHNYIRIMVLWIPFRAGPLKWLPSRGVTIADPFRGRIHFSNFGVLTDTVPAGIEYRLSVWMEPICAAGKLNPALFPCG